MFARALRVFLAFELAFNVALASWLHVARGWSLPAVVALAVGLIVGFRVAITLASFTIAWLNHPGRKPSDRIGPFGTLRMLASEAAALVRFQLFDCPWENLALRPDPPAAPASTTPIVVVHGYMANRGYLHPLVRRIEKAGLGPVFVPDFRTWFATIEVFAAEIHREVERIVAATGQPRVVLVAHSMGGLGCRAYLTRHGAGRVARLVTLCSPHHGTALAPLGSGENARQMRIGSAFLMDLERRENGAAAVPTLCVYSCHDNLVSPYDSAALEWARNVSIAGRGHVEILDDEALFAAVEAEIRAAAAPA